MTRRERMQNRLERRQKWAVGAEQKASNFFNKSHDLVKDIPPGQPILVGHHSEKRHRRTLDKSWNALGKACEQTKLAETHEQKAANIEAALDKTIFSDDENAVEALEQRIAEMEAKRARMVKVNALYRKKDVEELKALGLNFETMQAALLAAGPYFGKQPHMPYEMSNLGARIQADKKRLVAVKIQQQRAAKAEEEPGGITIEDRNNGYVQVTFAEKPAREVLNALREAGFYWGRGCWSGMKEKLPAAVAELLAA